MAAGLPKQLSAIHQSVTQAFAASIEIGISYSAAVKALPRLFTLLLFPLLVHPVHMVARAPVKVFHTPS